MADGDGEEDGRQIRTLADLARVAGVSTGTVSRALAGSSLVNPKTRNHIRDLARRHGVRPNQMASKLRSRRTGVIGVVIPLGHERRQHISDPFFMTLLGALADELTESGYDIMLSRAIPDENEEWLDRITGSGMTDGVIVIGQSDQFDTIERVAESYRPMVVWGHYRTGQRHCVVGTDNALGGRLAAEHLIARGATRLLFLGDTTGIEIAQRLAGVEQAAIAAEIELTHFPLHLSDEEIVANIGAALTAHAGPVDGIIAASDLIAMAALKELHARGRRVPDAVQIVGYDDLPLAAQTMPPLTTIRQDIDFGAKAIVDRLRRRIENEDADSLVMRPELIERETSRSRGVSPRPF
ncbi:LacI family transcriptional regulator [Sphingopyxis sp. H050]|jgi:DNA-binding LacI/PurR family transcriptional regulator|uniref:LacI family DNA-binding transcriptional regulator n=1 Tax=Sphingopyxis sp. H050 TaxID=1759072 RepID=UPI0007366A30|nr:substrate-binding domain-containing protein [Sphingopyxis sp. H050]KTE19647.1 LacI family transcriptional regulator [Sphingopyxis sp. H050]